MEALSAISDRFAISSYPTAACSLHSRPTYITLDLRLTSIGLPYHNKTQKHGIHSINYGVTYHSHLGGPWTRGLIMSSLIAPHGGENVFYIRTESPRASLTQ